MDLREADLAALLDGIDVVFHQAAQPGVRAVVGRGLPGYVANNIVATERLLDAVVATQVPKLVYASSSSIYGNASRYPTTEADAPAPFSPYGVTKLAAEHLCSAYAENFGLHTVSLRYFTVYGPRQRPDMAIDRILRAGLRGEPFALFGDGGQLRDFTYVDDVVAANLLAADRSLPAGIVLNVAGGSVVSMTELLELAGNVIGTPIKVERQGVAEGDVRQTGGSTALAASHLGWHPGVSLEHGLQAHVAWLRDEPGGVG